jgi:hypothetical protein
MQLICVRSFPALAAYYITTIWAQLLKSPGQEALLDGDIIAALGLQQITQRDSMRKNQNTIIRFATLVDKLQGD